MLSVSIWEAFNISSSHCWSVGGFAKFQPSPQNNSPYCLRSCQDPAQAGGESVSGKAPESEEIKDSHPITWVHPLFSLQWCVSVGQCADITASFFWKPGFPERLSLMTFPQVAISCFFWHFKLIQILLRNHTHFLLGRVRTRVLKEDSDGTMWVLSKIQQLACTISTSVQICQIQPWGNEYQPG